MFWGIMGKIHSIPDTTFLGGAQKHSHMLLLCFLCGGFPSKALGNCKPRPKRGPPRSLHALSQWALIEVFQRCFSYLAQKINSTTYYKSRDRSTKHSKQGDRTNILKEVTLFGGEDIRETISNAGLPVEVKPAPGPPS